MCDQWEKNEEKKIIDIGNRNTDYDSCYYILQIIV